MTATLAEPISMSGLYDISAEDYHRDPVAGGSLSASGVKLLLPPSCPARYRYNRDHPSGTKKAFDVGHAAHKLVLGAGPELVRIDADEWRTNAVKAEVAEVRERGAVPLKPADWDQVHAMAAALRHHPLAAALLRPGSGLPEQTVVWRDEATGIWRRAMLDWLPHPVPGRRMVIPDYKTADSAASSKFRRAAASFGYHTQDCWYRDAVVDAGLDDAPAFVFVVQEKEPPYLVNVVQLDEEALDVGRERNRRACEIFRDCTESGIWPGYGPEVQTISLPRWAVREHETADNFDSEDSF